MTFRRFLIFYSAILILSIVTTRTLVPDPVLLGKDPLEVNITKLRAQTRIFQGRTVKTRGTVRQHLPLIMYGDLSLGGITVVLHEGLLKPIEYSVIEVIGTIGYQSFEGGFYYLNVSSWVYLGHPAFPGDASLLESVEIVVEVEDGTFFVVTRGGNLTEREMLLETLVTKWEHELDIYVVSWCQARESWCTAQVGAAANKVAPILQGLLDCYATDVFFLNRGGIWDR